MATYLPMAKGVLIFPRQREKLCAWLTHSTYAFCRTNYPDLLTKPPEARITENSLRNTWELCAKLTRTSALPRACITFDWGFRLICPKADWSWLLSITKPSESTSIGAQPATSDRLHRPGGISRRAYAL